MIINCIDYQSNCSKIFYSCFMFSVKATLLLIVCCLVVQAAILPSEIDTSALLDKLSSVSDSLARVQLAKTQQLPKSELLVLPGQLSDKLAKPPKIVFRKYKPTGSSIWKSFFPQIKPLIRCPQGYFPVGNRCVDRASICPRPYVFQNGRCVCPRIFSFVNGQCRQAPTDKGSVFTGLPVLERLPSSRRLLYLNEIRQKVFPWYGANPIGSSLSTSTTPVQSKILSEDPYQICKVTSNDYSSPTEYFINIDNSGDTLWPGAFIRSKFVVTGAEALTSLPVVGTSVRLPVTVDSSDSNFPAVEAVPTSSQVNMNIRASILTSLGYIAPPVDYFLGSTDNVEQLVKEFDFNSKILDKLDINGGFGPNWKTRKGKYILALLQKINTYSTVMSLKPENIGQLGDPVGVFLKQNFDLPYADNLEQIGYWGPNDPPLYVSDVTYGRMIVITVEKNDYTTNLYNQIQSGNPDSGDISATFTSLFQDNTIKVFSIGPFNPVQITALTSGKWLDFFAPLPANGQVIQALKPIGFRLRDWKLQLVKVSNLVQINTLACQAKPPRKIQLRFPDYYKFIRIQLRKPGESGFKIIGNSNMDITDALADGDNQIWIHNEVAKPSILSSFQRRVTFQVLINGVTVYGPAYDGCTGCHSTGTPFKNTPKAAFICQKVNKYVGNPICSKP